LELVYEKISANGVVTLVSCQLIEHGFTSAPTQYRLYGRRFL